MSTRYTSFRKKCLRPPFRASSFPYPPGNKFHSGWQNADIKGSPDTFSYSLRISDALIALFPFSLLSTIVLYAVYDSLLTTPKKEPNDFERDLSSEKKNHRSCSMIISSPLGILLSPLVRFTRHFTRIRIRYIQESSL